MKCTHCGSNLNIDDKFCNFCGKENVEAVQHRKDMQNFRDDYIRTKRVVFEKSGRTVSIIAKVTIIAALVVACFLILLASGNAYRIRDWSTKVEIKKNIDTHKRNIERLEAERDFFGLTAYFDENALHLSKDFREYRVIVNLSSHYLTIYDYTFKLLNPNKESCSSIEDLAGYISEYIAWCYDLSEYNEYEPEKYSKIHMYAMDDLINELETFIHVYLKIPREEIETFKELSPAKIQLIIERSVDNAED